MFASARVQSAGLRGSRREQRREPRDRHLDIFVLFPFSFSFLFSLNVSF